MNKKILITAAVLSLLPAIIVGAVSNLGFALLAFVVCTAGGYFGYMLGLKIRDYAPVTAIFGKSQSDIAWKKFCAEHGSQFSGIALGIFIPFIILATMGNAWGGSNGSNKLKNEQSGTLSKNTEKIIKGNHDEADQDVAQYGDFKFKTAVQSEAVDDKSAHGVQVILRYEPKSDEYAKTLSTMFIPSMLQKPIMQPLENGIGFDGSEIGYDGNDSYGSWVPRLQDFTGRGKMKDWEQNVYRAKKEAYNSGDDYIEIPILAFADTIRKLDIDSVLFMNDDQYGDYFIGKKFYNFNYEGYDEAYKNYTASKEYIMAVGDFILTGKRKRDSYGGNLADWLDWNKYFYINDNGGYSEKHLTERSDYDHWYFDHNKQGTEADYEAFGKKYAAIGIPTEYEQAKEEWYKFLESKFNFARSGTSYEENNDIHYYNELKNNKPDTHSVGWYHDKPKSVSYEYSGDELVETVAYGYDELYKNEIQENYDKKFKQFLIAHWADYPDSFKLHREFENEAKENSSHEETVIVNDYEYDAWGNVIGDNQRTERRTVDVDVDTSGEAFYDWVWQKRYERYKSLNEIIDAFAKENGAEMLAAYDAKVEETFRRFYNVHIKERTKIFNSFIDLSKCKVYIDYKCLVAADNRNTLSAITDKRGVIAYKAQIESGKWVDAECYFTLREDPKDFLWL